ncbi:MAG: hypothetical protein KJ970_13310 [Candidatus Eisenbacteria bacterium]|uniref:Uncharacterized protein n=1 Tax=Eiseniibacteriota bacterium TaxID=2212470 RepID=A0A948RYF6_UNCEI|nr:hypothetical protein [Candidatus Eisenbacteria bacterium]MBU1947894.1 hypothetical protein [Candidatus Eisenbacteria bacterium]MBU2691892.1 hypothetical protein [Candidatus Eisenbacteria bacterium]
MDLYQIRRWAACAALLAAGAGLLWLTCVAGIWFAHAISDAVAWVLGL